MNKQELAEQQKKHQRILRLLDRIEARQETWKKTPRQRAWNREVWIPMLTEAFKNLTQ